MIRTAQEAVSFAELRWLREVADRAKVVVPELIQARLLKRGLIERKTGGVAITTRGRIALAKLG